MRADTYIGKGMKRREIYKSQFKCWEKRLQAKKGNWDEKEDIEGSRAEKYGKEARPRKTSNGQMSTIWSSWNEKYRQGKAQINLYSPIKQQAKQFIKDEERGQMMLISVLLFPLLPAPAVPAGCRVWPQAAVLLSWPGRPHNSGQTCHTTLGIS